MSKLVWLADLPHIPTPAHPECTPDEMEAARSTLIRRRLRYDPKTGALLSNGIELERSNVPDVNDMFISDADVMRLHFGRMMAKLASRQRRPIALAA